MQSRPQKTNAVCFLLCVLPLRFCYVCCNLNNYGDKVLGGGRGKGRNFPRNGKSNIVLWRDKGKTRIGKLNREEDGRNE